jgi:hypothetical protein
MSGSQLRAFADEAARQVTLPDLDGLARRGRALRTRRRTTAGVALLAVALLGTWFVQDRAPRADGPDPVDTPVRAYDRYPGNQMHDLPAGTYELTPSSVRGEPTALITLPDGWNTWEGPNRFNGHRPGDPTTGRYNEAALVRATWYAGVVVVKILAVTRDLCLEQPGHYRFVGERAETVDAVSHIPGYEVVEGPDRGTAFGYPATHLVYRPTAALHGCPAEAEVFMTSNNGRFSGEDRMELWVVDVEGVTLTVVVGSSGDVPPRIWTELDAAVDSIEFLPAQ